MNYNKGSQITVGKLKEYLSCIPDDIKVYIDYGENAKELHYLDNYFGNLLLRSDMYMIDATIHNMATVIELNSK